MLAYNNDPGVVAQAGIETEVCSWTSDGFAYLVGFMGTGSFSAEFRLYIGDDLTHVYQTSPGNRTAYVADRALKLAAGTVVSLRAYHTDVAAQTFKGTLLGGE